MDAWTAAVYTVHMHIAHFLNNNNNKQMDETFFHMDLWFVKVLMIRIWLIFSFCQGFVYG